VKRLLVLGDTHFRHANIIKYCNRPFATADEMDATMLGNIANAGLGPEDTLVHVGDFAFGGKERARPLLDFWHTLPGTKIFVRGNHDRGWKRFELLRGFDVVCEHIAIDKWLFTHYPTPGLVLDPGVVNVHGHIHNNLGEKWDDDQHFNACVEVRDYRPFLLCQI
jgi:calcineurin-like phosphoesterase family protein